MNKVTELEKEINDIYTVVRKCHYCSKLSKATLRKLLEEVNSAIAKVDKIYPCAIRIVREMYSSGNDVTKAMYLHSKIIVCKRDLEYYRQTIEDILNTVSIEDYF